jgi:hypothetical protein
MRYSFALLAASLSVGCIADPDPLPTHLLVAGANKQIERSSEPALYQMLYDYAFLPEIQHAEQRVRILLWLQRINLGDYQLAGLQELGEQVKKEHAALEARHRAIVEDYEPRLLPAYQALWDGLQSGASISDAALEESAQALLVEKLQNSRESELFAARTQAISGILDLCRTWLEGLRHEQEIPFADALFFLRHRLDPYANPGDFQSLVGTIFVAGDWGTLTRGAESFQQKRDHLNLGGLWSDKALEELEGPVFNDIRRETVLYMILLEPALGEAVQAARNALVSSKTPSPGP